MKSGMNENELLERIADLPREIRPENDPWPAILARLGEPGRTARFGRTRWLQAVAASAAIAVVAGLLFGPALIGPPGSQQSSVEVAGDIEWAESNGLPGVLAASEAEYLAAFREFIPVGESRGSLSPQALATIETGWSEMLNTENALAAALEDNPNDPFLNERMLELRARQLGFLKQLATLDLSNRRLTI